MVILFLVENQTQPKERKIFGEDEDIMQVHQDAVIEKVTEHLIDKMAKNGQSITKPK